MRIIPLIGVLLLFCTKSISQKKKNKTIREVWQKAIVNLETEGYVYPQYMRDSIYTAFKEKGYSQRQLDSIYLAYAVTQTQTGTAVYIIDKNRKYLLTAKHVLFDSISTKQKIFENATKKNNWDNDFQALYPRISLRTSWAYQNATQLSNNFAVYNNNFTKNVKPYIFIPEITGDGLVLLSLQENFYKLLDTLLQKNGYIPIRTDQIDCEDDLQIGEDIFTIGFPENVSVVARAIAPGNITLAQNLDLVYPFTCFGKVCMVDSSFHYYYVDLTIAPGNSGSPIIKGNKMVGIVSGINLYGIKTDEFSKILDQHLQGIGHLVRIIKVTGLKEHLRLLQVNEDNAQFNNK